MPDIFEGLELPPERVGRFVLVNPITGQPIRHHETKEPAWIEVVGWHSPQAQQHRFDTELQLRDLGRQFTPAEQHENMSAMLAKMTLRWHLLALDGKPLSAECTFANAKDFYNRLAMRPFRQALIDFLNNESNFPLAGPSASSTTPDTNSD